MIWLRSSWKASLSLAAVIAAALLSAPWPCRLHAGPENAPRLGARARAEIVDSIAVLLEQRYVDSTAAVQLARHLRTRLRAGAYDRDTLATTFANTLMRDMESVVKDLHLRLSYEPTREFVGGRPGVPEGRRIVMVPGSADWRSVVRTSRIDGRDSVAIARTNFGFVRVERMPGNVGYLKLDRFVPLDYSKPTADAALAFLANVESMIIDLRDNIGGSPDLVQYLASHFFSAEPVKIMEARNRAMGMIDASWTLREIPGRRLPGVDLVVLVGPNTASAAEAFAYGMQQTRRGLLAGARTAGAGHGGSKRSVGAGLALFLPEWQVTMGPGWEGRGVAPDLEVPVHDALGIVHRRLLEQRIGRETDPERRRSLEQALELAKAGS